MIPDSPSGRMQADELVQRYRRYRVQGEGSINSAFSAFGLKSPEGRGAGAIHLCRSCEPERPSGAVFSFLCRGTVRRVKRTGNIPR